MGIMKDTNITCNQCGRSFVTGAPKCNFNDSCLTEYPCTMQACIKNKQPDCTAKAVIPSITVDTVDGLTTLANCFVHVTYNNTTYYIDDKHRPMIIWAGPVELPDNYDVGLNEYGLAGQEAYVNVDGAYCQVYFDKRGVAHQVGIEEA